MYPCETRVKWQRNVQGVAKEHRHWNLVYREQDLLRIPYPLSWTQSAEAVCPWADMLQRPDGFPTQRQTWAKQTYKQGYPPGI